MERLWHTCQFSRTRNESPGLPCESPNLPDKSHFEPLFLSFKDFSPLRKLKLYLQIKTISVFKLVWTFLNAFLHLGLSKKHTLSEGGWCVFTGGEGTSGLTAESMWLILRGVGVLIRVTIISTSFLDMWGLAMCTNEFRKPKSKLSNGKNRSKNSRLRTKILMLKKSLCCKCEYTWARGSQVNSLKRKLRD